MIEKNVGKSAQYRKFQTHDHYMDAYIQYAFVHINMCIFIHIQTYIYIYICIYQSILFNIYKRRNIYNIRWRHTQTHGMHLCI